MPLPSRKGGLSDMCACLCVSLGRSPMCKSPGYRRGHPVARMPPQWSPASSRPRRLSGNSECWRWRGRAIWCTSLINSVAPHRLTDAGAGLPPLPSQPESVHYYGPRETRRVTAWAPVLSWPFSVFSFFLFFQRDVASQLRTLSLSL